MKQKDIVTVFVNNYDLKTINLNQYRKKVSALFQNYIQYESTIADNIIYGDICKQYSKEYVIDMWRWSIWCSIRHAT